MKFSDAVDKAKETQGFALAFEISDYQEPRWIGYGWPDGVPLCTTIKELSYIQTTPIQGTSMACSSELLLSESWEAFTHAEAMECGAMA